MSEIRTELEAIADLAKKIEIETRHSDTTTARHASRIYAATIRAMNALDDLEPERVERRFEIVFPIAKEHDGPPIELTVAGAPEQVKLALESAKRLGVQLREKP